MSRGDRAERLRAVMEREGATIGENARRKHRHANEALAELPEKEALREEARQIKERAIEDLPDLIEQVQDSVAANGGEVHVADTAAEARETVARIAAERGDLAVKSKSMTTEEVDLNEGLREAGVEPFETDLGEFVLQVADETPSHLIGPAIHHTPAEIADLLNDALDPDPPLPADPEALTEFAREHVGRRIREADVGITGANFVVAETGSLLLVTNEGNARKTAVTPDTHVAVAGIEKLVPSIEDLAPFVELIGRAGTGQDLTSYVSLLIPPVESPTVAFEDGAGDPANADGAAGPSDAGDRDFHLVLVDNGRTAMREDEALRETLYCVRCGACANSCENFGSVGGHAFGGETYTGGIASGWEHGLDEHDASEFVDLCTGCTRCVDNCPTKVDIPWINTVVRDRVNRGTDPETFDHLVAGLKPDDEPAGRPLSKRVFGNVDRLARAGSALAPVTNRLAEWGPARRLLERTVGIDAERPLPAFAGETLTEWARGRETVRDPEREVVLYPDTYMNYFLPERGRATVRALEALDVAVRVPEVSESGRAPLSQGMVATARARARRVSGTLAPHLGAGRDVVVVEPSDLAMVRRAYHRLLPEQSAERLDRGTYGPMEYLYGLLENGAVRADLPGGAARDRDRRVVYHRHCQGRTVGTAEYVTATLERAGYAVETTDVECCGMAGSFGYKTDYHDVSVDVGERLLADVAGRGGRLVAEGASCLQQLRELGDRPVTHPIALLTPGG